MKFLAKPTILMGLLLILGGVFWTYHAVKGIIFLIFIEKIDVESFNFKMTDELVQGVIVSILTNITMAIFYLAGFGLLAVGLYFWDKD